jgi:hypothetical protein
MEVYKETEWSGFYVGSNGTIINNTGLKMVKYKQAGALYVGIEYNGKRSMKRLADLVYRYHIRCGKPLLYGTIIKFRDGDPSNCKSDNLMAVDKASWHDDLPYGSVNNKKHIGVCYENVYVTVNPCIV